MSEFSNDIGNIYKNSFEDFNPQMEEDKWSQIEMKLDKLQFFKFSFMHFNIYYASVICLTFLFSSFLIASHFYPPTEKSKVSTDALNTPVLSDKKGNSISEKNYESNSTINNEVKKGNNSLLNNDTSNSITSETFSITISKIPDTIQTTADSTQTMQNHSVLKHEIKKAPARKKIVYITQQDTLIITDTVKTKSKRKLW